ncbi:hypothetical protein ADK38_46260 [Streptomyces varsoviensis]|uniref:Uncharacterized protein n=1 Tax=Streptomyces varsoviensis TaxID=67373 RepID=A0ABR5IRE1_9ACTN|nr:hypothetical protein ADK38_46260 [Streptomyces varsoviensis]
MRLTAARPRSRASVALGVARQESGIAALRTSPLAGAAWAGTAPPAATAAPQTAAITARLNIPMLLTMPFMAREASRRLTCPSMGGRARPARATGPPRCPLVPTGYWYQQIFTFR